MNMTVLVLCGGLSTRMEGRCSTVSKAMMEICNRPYLAWLVENIAKTGAEICLASGKHTTDIHHFFSRQEWIAKRVHVFIEPQPLGTGGAIHFAANKMQSENILVLNADTILIGFDPIRAAKWHVNSPYDITQVVSRHSNQNPGQILIRDNRVIGTTEGHLKQLSNARTDGCKQVCSTGAYIINRRFIISDWAGGRLSLEHELLPTFSYEGRVGAYMTDAEVYDFGTPMRFDSLKLDAHELLNMFP